MKSYPFPSLFATAYIRLVHCGSVVHLVTRILSQTCAKAEVYTRKFLIFKSFSETQSSDYGYIHDSSQLYLAALYFIILYCYFPFYRQELGDHPLTSAPCRGNYDHDDRVNNDRVNRCVFFLLLVAQIVGNSGHFTSKFNLCTFDAVMFAH